MLKANALFAFSQAANLWVVGAFSIPVEQGPLCLLTVSFRS